MLQAVQSTMLSRLEDGRNAEHDLTGYALITLEKRRHTRSAMQQVEERARASELLHLDEYRTLGRELDRLAELGELKAAKCLEWPEESCRATQLLNDGLAGKAE
ncbi:hypothetical protein PR048_031742 [Dryococelus australis]|uniref:Uncharacterized protein n=1 Tax=Dryococelus australis TaxID=614101 RepID=A0ABQ9G6S0_9NEOP|nr:hypothetical protein PR048_031742 [Dryococelus australis]